MGNPLADMPNLPTDPPAFTPTGRYTQERMEQVDKDNDKNFLWPAERRLLHHFVCLHNMAFAWNDAE